METRSCFRRTKNADYDVRLHLIDGSKKRTRPRLVISFGHNAQQRFQKDYKRARISQFGNGEDIIYIQLLEDERDKRAYKITSSKGCPRVTFTISTDEYKSFLRLWERKDKFTLYHEDGDLYFIEAAVDYV